MVLTRHLYSLDEVHAALVYASQRSDCSETVFWCRELIDSGYAAEAISTLFSAWMWHRGPFDLQWLVRAATTLASDAVTEEDILVSAHHLSQRCMRDHSLWTILTSTVPDRVTPRTPLFCSQLNLSPEELFFFRAVYQGKAQSAWWMARHMESSRVWELLSEYVGSSAYAESYRVCFQVLQHYESLLGYCSEDSNILCLAVLSACLSPAQQEKSFRVLPLTSVVMESPAETIRRSRRYSIPTACLYGDTARGRMTWSQSTLRSLRELHEVEGPFWEEHTWTTEEEREAFYDRFFPDDPPDEWTLAEQQRSHGDGVLASGGCTMEKYARLFLSHTSRLAWSTGNEMPPMGAYPGTIWVSVPPLQEVEAAFLVPVVRRLRVPRA
jgi:hypothetical protein